MFYDKETNRYFLNEFHLEHYKACLRANENLRKRLPLSPEEVAANQRRWNALGEQDQRNHSQTEDELKQDKINHSQTEEKAEQDTARADSMNAADANKPDTLTDGK